MKTVALLQKHGLIAILGLAVIGDSTILYRYDPRSGVTSSLQDSEEVGRKRWAASARKSTRRDWQLIYAGAPMWG